MILWSACNAANSATGNNGNNGNTSPVAIKVNGTFPVGVVGAAYPAQKTAVLTASGGTAPYTWSVSKGSFPPGLTLNSTTGSISGTPTTAGQTWGFTVQVKDANSQTATQGVSITIDTAIVVATISLPGGSTGGNYSASVSITGGTAPYTAKIASGSLPPGLSLNASSGNITGVPTTVGKYSFAIQITDADNVSFTSNTLSITIATPLVITTSSSLATAVMGVPYQQALNATGGIAPYTWSISAGSFPPGLSINASTGMISGTPTAAVQQWGFTIQVSDSNSATTKEGVSITVDTPIVIGTTGQLAPGTTGGNYTSSLSVTGGTWPYAVKVASGSLPPGITVNAAAGAIAGVPTTAGNYNFTLQFTDADNISATSNTLSISIAQQAPLTITTSSFPAATAGVPYQQGLNATGGIAPYTWSISSGSAPGLQILAVGLAGTPEGAGTDQFTLKVTDSAATPNSMTQNYNLTVSPGPGTYACGTLKGSESLMSGQWAFFMKGFDRLGAPYAIAGSLTADGTGLITAGEEDYNDRFAGPVNDAFNTSQGSSSYMIDSTGRGCLNIVTLSGSNLVYSFVLSATNPGKGRIIELDDANNTPSTTRVTGVLRQQTSADFALSSMQPNYAFGGGGWNSNFNAVALGGSFTLDTSTGNISAGYEDVNTGGTATNNSGLSGSIGSTFDSNGRGTMTYGNTITPAHYTIYIVNRNEFFMVGSDAFSSKTPPLTSGEAIVTGSSFTTASLSGGFILETTGFSTTSLPNGADVMIGQLSFDSTTHAVTGTLYEDKVGTSSNPPVSTAAYTVATSGRVTSNGIGLSSPVIYLTTPTDGIDGFIVGTDASASYGLLEAQTTGPYSDGSLSGNYMVGTAQLGDGTGAIDQVGYIDFAAGAVGTGIFDQNQPGTTGVLLNQPLNQTYSINSDGTGNAGTNTAAVTNGSTIYFINETPLADPSILVIEQ